MALSSKDFSVVIQGPISGKPGEAYEKQQTRQCTEGIRHFLPDAEIILSTWHGEIAEHLDYDRLVYNEDPGAITYNDYELKTTYNNNNRQIVSTYAGLVAATRPYSIKMRADLRICNTNFMEFLGKYPARWKYEFLSEKILIPTYFARNPEKLPLLFHISDLFMVGKTSDLRDLWNIPLQPEPQTTRAIPYESNIANDPFRHNKYKMRYASEQYIWYAFAKKKGLDLSLNYFSEVPRRLIAKASVSVFDNFNILAPDQLGLQLPARLIHGEKKLYSFEDFESLYNSLCVKHSQFRLFQMVVNVKLVSANYIFKNSLKQIKQKFRSKK